MNIQYFDFTMEDSIEVMNMMMDLYKEDASGPVITPQKIHNTLKELIRKKEKGKIIVFKKDGNIIGYGIIIFFWSNQYGGDIIVFDELYIKPPWRNNGIATAYFRYVFKEYVENVVAFKLEVTVDNNRARALYERLGFELAHDLTMIKAQ